MYTFIQLPPSLTLDQTYNDTGVWVLCGDQALLGPETRVYANPMGLHNCAKLVLPLPGASFPPSCGCP